MRSIGDCALVLFLAMATALVYLAYILLSYPDHTVEYGCPDR